MKVTLSHIEDVVSYGAKKTYDKLYQDMTALPEKDNVVDELYIHDGNSDVVFDSGNFYTIVDELHKYTATNSSTDTDYILVTEYTYTVINSVTTSTGNATLDLNTIFVKNAAGKFIPADADPNIIRADVLTDHTIVLYNQVDLQYVNEDLNAVDGQYKFYQGKSSDKIIMPITPAVSVYNSPNVKITRDSVNKAFLGNRTSFVDFMQAINNNGVPFGIKTIPSPIEDISGTDMYGVYYKITAYKDLSTLSNMELKFSNPILYNGETVTSITLTADSFDKNGICIIKGFYDSYYTVFQTTVTLAHYAYTLPEASYFNMLNIGLRQTSPVYGDTDYWLLLDSPKEPIKFNLTNTSTTKSQYINLYLEGNGFEYYFDEVGWKIHVKCNGFDVTDSFNFETKSGGNIWIYSKTAMMAPLADEYAFEIIFKRESGQDFIDIYDFNKEYNATNKLPEDKIPSLSYKQMLTITPECIPTITGDYKVKCINDGEMYKFVPSATSSEYTGSFRLVNPI